MKTTLRFALALSLLGVVAMNLVGQTTPPNVLIFFVDDMGYGDSPLYNPDSQAKMPNLDALAAAGMRFTDAHTPAAVCAPSRYSILSGNYPWRSRTHEGVWHFNGNSAFLDGQRTIANELQDAGYNTAMIGKSHLGGLVREKGSDHFITERWGLDWTRLDLSRRVENDPTEKGFNYTFLSYGGIQGQPFAFFENGWLVGNHEDLFLWKKGDYYDDQGRYEILIDGFGLPEWKSHTSAAVLYDAARSFLNDHFAKNAENDTQTPFFLHYCTPAVHLPHTPPKTFHGVPIKGASGSTEHVDMLYEVDVALGMLIDELEAHGQLDNTLIIFVSDNGGLTYSYNYGHNSNAPLRRSKAYIYEGGHRVPMVVRWGDGTPEGSRIQPNSTADQLVAVQDLYATIADIVGVEVAPDQAVDSRSIAPVLLENSAEPVHEYMLFQDFYRFGPQRAIREGSWKLISGWNGGALELYDLATDLGERDNRVDDPEQAERIERMLAKLDEMIVSDRTTPSLKAIVPLEKTPTDLSQPGAFGSDEIALIAEQSLELESDLAVDIATPRSVYLNATSAREDGVVPAGTKVKSYLLHYAPEEGGLNAGTVEFDQPILGLIYDDSDDKLSASDALLGLDGVTYAEGGGVRSSVVEGGDALWVSADGRSLSVTLRGKEKVLEEIPLPDPGFEGQKTLTRDSRPWHVEGHEGTYGDETTSSKLWTGEVARSGNQCVQFGENTREQWNNLICYLDSSIGIDREATYHLEAWIRRIPGNEDSIMGVKIQAGHNGHWRDVKFITFRSYSDTWTQMGLRIRPQDYPDDIEGGEPMRIVFFRYEMFGYPGMLIDDLTLRKVAYEPNGGIDEIRVLVEDSEPTALAGN